MAKTIKLTDREQEQFEKIAKKRYDQSSLRAYGRPENFEDLTLLQPRRVILDQKYLVSGNTVCMQSRENLNTGDEVIGIFYLYETPTGRSKKSVLCFFKDEAALRAMLNS